MKRKFKMSYQELHAMLMAVNHYLTTDYRDILYQNQIYKRSRIVFLHLRTAFLILFAPFLAPLGQEGEMSILDFNSRGTATARLS